MNDQSPISDSPLELTDAHSVVVLLPKNPSFACVASGLALYLSLEKAGKNVEIACPSQMLVEVNRLVGVQKIQTKLSGRNLVISFDYVKDAIEKVSYNVENGKFNLVVVPKPDHAALDHHSVTYSYTGADGDVAVLIGTRRTESVGDLIPQGESAKNLLSLVPGPDRTLASEVALVIASLSVTPDVDIANNLFAGLLNETDNFQRASAVDFETAAALIRAGAARQTEHLVVKSETPEEINPDWLKPKIFRAGESN